MSLNMPDLFSSNKLFNSEETTTVLEAGGHSTFIFSPGMLINATTTAVSLEVNTATQRSNVIGYKVTYDFRFFNGTVSDSYSYRIQNQTKSIVLMNKTSTLNSGTGVAGTYTFTVDQVTPGDIIEFMFTDGLVGTANNEIGTYITTYMTIPGTEFMCEWPVDDEGTYLGGYLQRYLADTIEAPVILPQGAVVLAAVVIGEGSGTWYLKRASITSTSSSTMATASMSTEDTSISYATIDNSLYRYFFTVGVINSDYVLNARIAYKRPGLLGYMNFDVNALFKSDIDGQNDN